MRKKKNIKIGRAKRLQEHLNFFFTEDDQLANFDLLNDDGTIHKHSEEFQKAVLDYRKSKTTILKILGL